MTHKGIVKDNTVIINSPSSLTNGTEVCIIPLGESADPVCGSWNDDRSPEDVINDIRSARFSKERDIDL